MSSPVTQENMTSRKSLKTIQQSILLDKVVGKPAKKVEKHHLSLDSSIDLKVKRKQPSTKNKEAQVNLNNVISEDDLTNPEAPSEQYWQVLAEKRQVALQEVLEENHKLRSTIDELQQELAQHKQMLEEANSFVEVIKEELAHCSKDDTGIDVNDVSTTEETPQEEEGQY